MSVVQVRYGYTLDAQHLLQTVECHDVYLLVQDFFENEQY